MVKASQVILTPSKIFALSVTRLIALPAPPDGYINNILGVSHDMEFGTLAYTGATKIQYQSKDGNNILEDSVTLPAVVNTQIGTVKSVATQGVFSTTEDFYVTANGVAANGDSTINAFVIYEQVQIGA